MSTSAKFQVEYFQTLNESAEVCADLPDFANNPEELIDMYRAMVKTRVFDKKAVALQRTGQLGTYPSSLGQEAISVAAGFAMQDDDVLAPYYREYGAQFLRGVSMTEILLYWGGDERGMDYQKARQDFPICVPIASQGPHAVGAAYAMKFRNEKRATVVFFGDGSTSKGDFYESLNAAGAWNLPLVFIVNNNQWAISVPRAAQTHCETIAQKAISGGFEGEQVDGNDIIALRSRIQSAIDNARNGKGPALIEAITYRLCDHTTADDASRYRSNDEVEEHWKIEPIKRLYDYMVKQNIWDEQKESQLLDECQQLVEVAVNEYLDTPSQDPQSIFEYMYERWPENLAEQKSMLNRPEDK